MSELLAYEESGAGPVLVFLHGITADRSHWSPVVQLLADRFRCINVDLSGHGASPVLGGVDLFAQIGAVGALLQHLQLEAPVLVGHSYGGFIATFAATALSVRGVVNVDQTFDTEAFQALLVPLAERFRGDPAAFTGAWETFFETLRADLVPGPYREAIDSLRPTPEVVLGVWEPSSTPLPPR